VRCTPLNGELTPQSPTREGPDERATGEGGRPEAAGNGPDRLVLPSALGATAGGITLSGG